MTIDLSDITFDPDLSEDLVIIRTVGKFAAGAWQVTSTTSIPATGVFAVADDKALAQVPEGDRVVGSMQFITATPIYPSSEAGAQISDKIQFEGDLYRVQSVGPWEQYGFYSAILSRVTGS